MKRARGMHAHAFAFVFSASLAAATGAAWAQSGADDDVRAQQEELERIRKEIEAHREQSQKLKSQEKQVLKKLSGLDKEIDLTKRYIGKLEKQEQLIDDRIIELRQEIGERGVVLSHQEEALARRLRQLYKRDPQYRWEVILGAKSIDDALARYQFTKLIAAQDARLIAEFRSGKSALESETARLAEALHAIAGVRESREAENTQLQRSKKQRQATLVSIRSEKSKHQKAIEDLERAQQEIQDLLGRLSERVPSADLPPSGEFSAMKGRLLWPVDGKVIRGFGKHTHPKYGTVTMNNGIDIQARGGTPILAVAAGVVEFVDWIDAFGKCVILNHGGGYYTLYAHVASTFAAQGQKVERGDVIAEVGDTGSLDGYVCHFEVRQSRKALNPTEWLGRRAKPSS